MEHLEKNVKCTSCEAYETVLPANTVQNCNQGVCNIHVNDPNGLGLDRYTFPIIKWFYMVTAFIVYCFYLFIASIYYHNPNN